MEKFEKTKVEIAKSPVDVILDGVILEVSLGLLSDNLSRVGTTSAGWSESFKLKPYKADRKGHAAVKKIKPVPWDNHGCKTYAALVFKKPVNIPIDGKQTHHDQNSRDKKPCREHNAHQHEQQ